MRSTFQKQQQQNFNKNLFKNVGSFTCFSGQYTERNIYYSNISWSLPGKIPNQRFPSCPQTFQAPKNWKIKRLCTPQTQSSLTNSFCSISLVFFIFNLKILMLLLLIMMLKPPTVASIILLHVSLPPHTS